MIYKSVLPEQNKNKKYRQNNNIENPHVIRNGRVENVGILVKYKNISLNFDLFIFGKIIWHPSLGKKQFYTIYYNIQKVLYTITRNLFDLFIYERLVYS